MKKEINDLLSYMEGLDLPSEKIDHIKKSVSNIDKGYELLDFKFQRTIIEKQAIIRFLSKVSEDLEKKMEEVGQKNIELKEARLTADKASQAKSNFLATMSHEIRTPLNGFYGMLQLLEQSQLTEEQTDYVKVFKKSGEDLMYLINDVLDFSKIEADKLKLEEAPFSIKDTLTQINKLCYPKTHKKGLYLHMVMDESLPEVVVGDARRLSQILNNLLDNAIKFTKEGGISMYAESVKVDDKIATLRISVKDTGIGISNEHLDHLFKPFTQADNSIGRRFGGTGLGLSISGELAALMNGSLSVTSERGSGSTFSLEVSLPYELNGNSKIKDQQQTILDKRLAQKHPANILLVEDNEINQLLIEVILNKLGYKIKKADDGFQALEQVASHDFDLIFMDLQLPEMNGWETSKRILSRPDLSLRPTIIGISANVSPQDRESCITAGMVDFLPKPFQLNQIEEIIKKWVPKNQLIEANERGPMKR